MGTYGITDSNVVKEALIKGYRLLDGASFYKNEEIVGKGVKDSGIEREKIYIISKVWWDEVEDVEAACRRSLERLGTDYVDLYLVHWPIAVRDAGTNDQGETVYERIKIPMYKIWAQMEALVDKGLVKNIGVSNFNVQLTWDMLSYARIKPAFNEVEIHPLNSQPKLLHYLKSEGIVPIGYCPLARGADTRRCPNLLIHESVASIAQKHGVNASQVLLAWGIAKGCVEIPKTSNLERLQENADCLKIQLDAQDIQLIDQINEGFRICDNYPWLGNNSIFA